MRIANNTEWLFFHLWKRDPETSLPCQNLNIAETILFRWAQPYFWYYTAKDGTLVRKTKDKVVLSHVEEAFLINVPKCNVVGTCLNSVEDPNFKTQEKIEFDFLEQSTFHNFLFQKEKPMNLILQKFIEPKNNKNALIKVSWTPQFCIFFRRTNNNDLSNSKVPLINRLATFEGAEHLSTADSVSAPILASELEQTCLNIVRHIQNVTGGNIQISKMVLYFKLDERNRLWLLFCTGLKFRDKVNPITKAAAAKKKNQRPLSPVFTIASKKEEKNTKAVPQQYLLEDQVNEVNTEACLKCNKEGLLYDLKMKLVLEYEEKLIHEGVTKGIIHQDTSLNPYKSFDLMDKREDAPNVPVIMKKLYPNINQDRYSKLKTNMSFMNTSVKLCEECYLLATESVIENNEERKAKNMKQKLKEKSSKNETAFGMQVFKEPEPLIAKGKLNQLLPLRSVEEEDTSSPLKLYSQSSRSSKFVGQILNKNEPNQNKSKKISAFSFQTKLQASQSQSNLDIEEKPKVGLPHIESARDPVPRLSQIKVKEHYFRAVHSPDKDLKGTLRSIVSPYSFVNNLPQNKPEMRKMNTTGPIVGFKELRASENLENEIFPKPREGLWSQSTKNSARTNYTSMMNTIKDLKVFLGQNLDLKE